MTSDHHTSAMREIGHLAWPLLGLVAAVLIGTVAFEVQGSSDPEPMAERSMVSAPSPPSVAVVASPGPDNSPQWAERTLARPLFSETRRPPADTPVVTAGSAKLPRLTGVVVSPVGGFAIFAGVEGGKPIVAREGDQIGAVVVEAVAAGQVTLRGPEGVLMLRPSFGEGTVQVSRLSPASPPRPGYRPRQGGHDAAILNRQRAPAT